MEFINVLNPMLSLFQNIYDIMLVVFDFFTLPLTEVLEEYGELWLFNFEDILSYLIDIFERTIGVEDISLLGIMLGVGLPIYLIYQFVTWVLNVVT